MKKLLILLFTLFLPLQCFAKNINVAFTIDNNYPIYTLLLIDSILQNNTSNSDYTFYIVENNVTEKNKQKMKKHVTRQNQNIEFIHFDTESIDNGAFYFTFSNRITPIAMARIMLPEILPKDVDKVLYLDGDMLATTDIKPLYDTDLDNYLAVMCPNINIMTYPKFKFNNGYFNSGLILMDVNKWRKEKTSQKLADYLEKNSEDFIFHKTKNPTAYLYPDQDLINIVLDKRIKTLDKRWNNQTLRQAVLEPDAVGIYHYIASIKPWHFPPKRIYTQNAYFKNWEKSSLSIYRYYYAYQKVVKEYIKFVNKKIGRLYDFIGIQRPRFVNEALKKLR